MLLLPPAEPALILCACILVLMTSKGCSARLETRPALDPATNEVVPLLTPEEVLFLSRSDEFDEDGDVDADEGDREDAFSLVASRVLDPSSAAAKTRRARRV